MPGLFVGKIAVVELDVEEECKCDLVAEKIDVEVLALVKTHSWKAAETLLLSYHEEPEHQF